MNKYGFTRKEMEYLSPDPIEKMNRSSRAHLLTRTTAIAILVLVILISLFIRWSEANTQKAEAAFGSYDTCVMSTYGVTATEFYQVYGHAAKCK